MWGIEGIKWKFWPKKTFFSFFFFPKTVLVTFYCCFFKFFSKFPNFSKNTQKVKVNILAINTQNHQILLKTYSLMSLDIIWYILWYSIDFTIFCDMRNQGGQKLFFFFAKISILCPRFLTSQKMVKSILW